MNFLSLLCISDQNDFCVCIPTLGSNCQKFFSCFILLRWMRINSPSLNSIHFSNKMNFYVHSSFILYNFTFLSRNLMNLQHEKRNGYANNHCLVFLLTSHLTSHTRLRKFLPYILCNRKYCQKWKNMNSLHHIMHLNLSSLSEGSCLNNRILHYVGLGSEFLSDNLL